MTEKEAMPDAGLDLDKFAIAVSHAETGGCKKGSAISHNNCFGIMRWDAKGNRYLKKFNSHEESFEAFKKLWSTKYGGFPTYAMAATYTGNDKPDTWLGIVKHYYFN